MMNSLLPIPYFSLIVNMCNASFMSGKIPDILKTNRIVPIPKVDNATRPDQFRPISITPVLLLLMEKIYFCKLAKYVHDNILFTPSQFGFRKHHSCEIAMLAMTDFIRKVLNNGGICVPVSIDLRKAFDSVHRGKLLSKLYNLYG